jgi:NAD(P)-dependent dehydrogenase (short-subunit alcohol dehydrogenase family)
MQKWRRRMGTYLIYGGAGAIGSAIARRLAKGGHKVHLAGRDAAKLQALAGELGGSFTVGDVLQAGVIEKVTADAGASIDGLVYAVGSINLKPLPRLTETDFLNDFNLNALSAAKAVQAALPALKAAAGTSSVLLFSTIAVAQGFASHASVSMAKGAIEGLTRALSAELAPKIRVNAIAPSLTDSGIAKPIMSNDAVAKAVAALHALPRTGVGEDMAGIAETLLTDAGSWITGQVIAIDGGRSRARTKG